MTREGVKTLFKTLCVFYPRSYSYKDDDTARVWLEDFTQAFSRWDDEDVSQALRAWRKEHSEAPQVADLIREVKIVVLDRKPFEPYPEKPKTESVKENPWKKAADEMVREHHKKPE